MAASALDTIGSPHVETVRELSKRRSEDIERDADVPHLDTTGYRDADHSNGVC